MLGSFADSLAFEGLPGADIDFDLLGLGLCLLGKADLQHAFIFWGLVGKLLSAIMVLMSGQ